MSDKIEQIPSKIHSSWHPYLDELFQSRELKKLKYDILKDGTFYPDKNDIFNVFQMPLNKIRVVILGQDPYYTSNHANGYAFATKREDKIPFSLSIIETELIQEKTLEAAKEFNTIGHDYSKDTSYRVKPDLSNWRDQGVFLLNTSLTVEKDKPNSHKQYWRNFTSFVIGLISKEVNPVWLLWGKEAQDYEILIVNTAEDDKKSVINTNGEKELGITIFKAAHPASEAPTRNGGFLGCNHFNNVNEYFKSIDEQPIIW